MAKKTKSAKRASHPRIVRRSRGAKRAKSSRGVTMAARRGRGVSIHIGLNAVSPAHYEGWSGDLQACEFDAKDMAALARAAGITPTILLTKNATRAKALERYDSFLEALGRRLAKGPKLRQEIGEEGVSSPPA